jgi:nickel-dependent lactate racemase
MGGVVYHYHAGFGGGRKSLVPGLAGRDTIAFNHSLTLDPDRNRLHPRVGPGRLDGNPVAEEMLEAARLCRPDAIVNTVLDPSGRLVGVFAGDLDLAHRAACARAAEALSAPMAEPADLVVASTGSARNWIQSHKALYNAHRAVRRGGQVVLLAPCPEGIGEDSFRRWVRRPRLKDIYAGLRADPDVLGQTALSTRIRGRRTVLVTSMSADEAAELKMALAPDAASGIRLALDRLAAQGILQPTCLLLPDAMALLPVSMGTRANS